MLTSFRNPFRHPQTCSRHPLYSEPCIICLFEVCPILPVEQNVEVQSKDEDSEAQNINIRDDAGSGPGGNASGSEVQGP
jgi:hypothetical protein